MNQHLLVESSVALKPGKLADQAVDTAEIAAPVP